VKSRRPVFGVFIPAVSDVRADPFEFQAGMAVKELVEFLDEIEVLDRSAFFGPALGLPAMRPDRDRLHAQLAVGEDDGCNGSGRQADDRRQQRQRRQ